MPTSAQTSKSRMMLLLIAGIPLTVILTATWLWYYVIEGELDLVAMLGTSNKGTLVQPPRALADVDMREAQGLPFHYSKMDPKWTLLIPGQARCDEICEKTLYTTRQIHIAMGKQTHRIRRLYLSDTPAPQTTLSVSQLSDGGALPQDFEQFLATQHRGMTAVTISSAAHAQLLAESATSPGTWYLVDPAGWIMMSYDGGIDYKGVMSDLKFLLKNSSE